MTIRIQWRGVGPRRALGVVALLCVAIGTTPAAAQTVADSASAAARGEADGRAAGARQPAARWFWAGAGGGLLVGAGALMSYDSSIGVAVGVPTVAGTAIVARTGSVQLPARQRAQLAGADSIYRHAYVTGYADAVQRKRARRVWQGSLLGVLSGAALIVYLLTHGGSDT